MSPTGQPCLRPAFADGRNEEPQREAGGPIAQKPRRDGRYDAAVLVENRVSERYVTEGPRQNRQQQITPRAAELARSDAQRIEPQKRESQRGDREVVQRSEQEDLQPFAEREAEVGGLFVEQQYDAHECFDREGQQDQFEVEAPEQAETVLHKGVVFCPCKITVFLRNSNRKGRSVRFLRLVARRTQGFPVRAA